MAQSDSIMDTKSARKGVTFLSSDDDEKDENLPKILNTISLQGCNSVSFEDQDEDDVDNLLYPSCEIKEEESAEEFSAKDSENIKQNGHVSPDVSKRNEEKKPRKEKKKIQLTQLPTVKHRSGPKPSTSRLDDTHVVDARRLAIQESLFKTKELFDTFLRVCQDQENSEQMERVVQKMGQAYDKARKEFLGSLEFQNILESETEKVNTSNSKPWLNLKLVLDEMKHNRLQACPKLKLGDSEDSDDAEGGNDEEPVIECPKKRRHLKKLEKTLRAINLKIKKLEEREVDLDDDDSSYIKLDRYRSQFTKIYNKVCEIKGKLPDADRPYLRKVSFAGTTYPHINRCIERYYNKHREFPDFQDIKKLVMVANEQENINMPPIKIHSMAASAFKEFGEMLKRLRQYDDYDVIISYLEQQVDPARDDDELREQLNKNALLFKKKEQEVIDKFAAQDAGLHSESDSENKPKKKKKKIILTGQRKKSMPSTSTSVKRHLSSGSSNEEEDEVKNNKIEKPAPSLSSSSSSSESESKNPEKKRSVKAKGKTLIGKRRVVKRSVPQNTLKKAYKPNTVISSDEESVQNDTKDSFTNYLGLKGTPAKTETKESTIKEEVSEDEISCVQEIKSSQAEKKAKKRKSLKSKFDSEDDIKEEKISQHFVEINDKSDNSDSSSKEPEQPSSKNIKEVVNNEDNNSDSEPIAIVKEIVTPVKKIESISQPRMTSAILRTCGVNSNKISSLISDSSDERTSDGESEEKKSATDVELSTGTKDLSSDSSDNNEEEKKENDKKEADLDDSCVILSEEVTVNGPVAQKPTENGPSKSSGDSSDSDDIFILSQDSGKACKVKSSKAEKMPKSNSGPNYINRRTTRGPFSSFGTDRSNVTATSNIGPAPLRKSKSLLKRRLLRQSTSESNSKRPKKTGRSSSVESVDGDKQPTLPQIINGASRKTVITRIQRTCRPVSSSPESIPLIELD